MLLAGQRRRMVVAAAVVAAVAAAGLLRAAQVQARRAPAGVVVQRVRSLSSQGADALARRLASRYGGWLPAPAANAMDAALPARLHQRTAEEGASPDEIEGVVRVVRQIRVRRGHWPPPGTLAVPVIVQHTWAEGRPVWALRFSWGMRGSYPNGGCERPGHYWVVVVGARPPYPVMAEQSCQ